MLPTCIQSVAAILALVTNVASFQQQSTSSFAFSSIFGDDMVLQYGVRAAVYGVAPPNSRITVNISKDDVPETTIDHVPVAHQVSTVSDAAGIWKALLKEMPAGGTYTITASAQMNQVYKDYSLSLHRVLYVRTICFLSSLMHMENSRRRLLKYTNNRYLCSQTNLFLLL